ncbi:unnamed protein product [Blepharisma stoltei]|uniref:Uncharacterized protein n=1 Tax=Blepharisma stoltei TaxID=1481888 RepID=A0AAU9J5I3_9CILI|nr:unnamed protein product [Blepharisma stoltei]
MGWIIAGSTRSSWIWASRAWSGACNASILAIWKNPALQVHRRVAASKEALKSEHVHVPAAESKVIWVESSQAVQKVAEFDHEEHRHAHAVQATLSFK